MTIWQRFLGRPSNEVILYRGRSAYRFLEVVEFRNPHHRVLYTGKKRFVAGIELPSGKPLYSPYQIVEQINFRPRSFLFLGGGPQAVPSYVWYTQHPDVVDVVERDPVVTDLAKKYFRIPDDLSYRIHHQDALEFILNSKRKYDVIYNNIGLTRRRGLSERDLRWLSSEEGYMLLKRRLTMRGILVYCVVGRYTGEDLIFLKRCAAGMTKAFPSVFFLTDGTLPKNEARTHVFVAHSRKTSRKAGFYQPLPWNLSRISPLHTKRCSKK